MEHGKLEASTVATLSREVSVDGTGHWRYSVLYTSFKNQAMIHYHTLLRNLLSRLKTTMVLSCATLLYTLAKSIVFSHVLPIGSNPSPLTKYSQHFTPHTLQHYFQ